MIVRDPLCQGMYDEMRRIVSGQLSIFYLIQYAWHNIFSSENLKVETFLSIVWKYVVMYLEKYSAEWPADYISYLHMQ